MVRSGATSAGSHGAASRSPYTGQILVCGECVGCPSAIVPPPPAVIVRRSPQVLSAGFSYGLRVESGSGCSTDSLILSPRGRDVTGAIEQFQPDYQSIQIEQFPGRGNQINLPLLFQPRQPFLHAAALQDVPIKRTFARGNSTRVARPVLLDARSNCICVIALDSSLNQWLRQHLPHAVSQYCLRHAGARVYFTGKCCQERDEITVEKRLQ